MVHLCNQFKELSFEMYFNAGMYLVLWKVSWCTQPLWCHGWCNRKSHHAPPIIIITILIIIITIIITIIVLHLLIVLVVVMV